LEHLLGAKLKVREFHADCTAAQRQIIESAGTQSHSLEDSSSDGNNDESDSNSDSDRDSDSNRGVDIQTKVFYCFLHLLYLAR
jgi:hypothetical protein